MTKKLKSRLSTALYRELSVFLEESKELVGGIKSNLVSPIISDSSVFSLHQRTTFAASGDNFEGSGTLELCIAYNFTGFANTGAEFSIGFTHGEEVFNLCCPPAKLELLGLLEKLTSNLGHYIPANERDTLVELTLDVVHSAESHFNANEG
ncbi:hypothetical protein [Vibrio alginolyticus]|uniref:hypothetical protein n=1 Tax=Vibrio alginolyticus TaxID=663 RepID=UPI0006CAAA43|nr:hypothetical protein [Vibrio alginolyticus]KPM98477.1 hypothetical protein AOG25_08510 [Vibrio alginolyticus]CAH7143290.1 conserved hypothetical protein [Vibrio chagasii]CAH7234376.1 conserved hypothetical protein [Vibrio chagasii]